MHNIILISSLSVFSSLLFCFLLTVIFLNIKNYILFKRKRAYEDKYHNLNSQIFHDIINLLNKIDRSYPKHVYLTLSAKVYYILNLITKYDNLQKQNEFLQKLYNMIYETNSRLKTDYYNIAFKE